MLCYGESMLHLSTRVFTTDMKKNSPTIGRNFAHCPAVALQD